ncbi:E3 ubiquitin-protein ligase RSL1-like [Lotus japonicus]|uniref:E3 ubiquitin-protein ligase RSL1-like n=1 Tax=Lotus japonicus TaxID=34305 RepID=UPI00258F3C45|nr:E3 ubiquitin-protein ligase RSL1-like [Lotus japonicus]
MGINLSSCIDCFLPSNKTGIPLTLRTSKRVVVPSSTDDGDGNGDVKVLSSFERGEGSNNAPPFICEICTETKTAWESFGITGCSHAYCSDCVAMYVRSKLEENVVNIQCPVPGCSGQLEAEDCRVILPVEVFDRWGKAASEAVFAESEKFYCPFANCSALLINDGTVVIMESECPVCRRRFCAQCKVPWHVGVTCDEYQRLSKDERRREEMLIRLAMDHKWRRCPNCKIYVERRSGCDTIKCRSGFHFLLHC